MKTGKIQKNLIRASVNQSFCILECQQQPLICFRRKKKSIKLTLTKTEILPSSLPGHCGEADGNRVRVVPRPFAPGPRAGGGKISGTWGRPQLSFRPHSSVHCLPKVVHPLARYRWAHGSWWALSSYTSMKHFNSISGQTHHLMVSQSLIGQLENRACLISELWIYWKQ